MWNQSNQTFKAALQAVYMDLQSKMPSEMNNVILSDNQRDNLLGLMQECKDLEFIISRLGNKTINELRAVENKDLQKSIIDMVNKYSLKNETNPLDKMLYAVIGAAEQGRQQTANIDQASGSTVQPNEAEAQKKREFFREVMNVIKDAKEYQKANELVKYLSTKGDLEVEVEGNKPFCRFQ